MKLIAAIAVLMMCGCSTTPLPYPDIMYGTHMVWRSSEFLDWQSSDGYNLGCGSVEREERGWVYRAHVNNWNHPDGINPAGDYNNLQDAETFVERWCKP